MAIELECEVCGYMQRAGEVRAGGVPEKFYATCADCNDEE